MHKIKFLRVVAYGAAYETNISYLHTILKDFIEFQMAGSWPVGYLQSMEELNSGQPRTNLRDGFEPGNSGARFNKCS